MKRKVLFVHSAGMQSFDEGSHRLIMYLKVMLGSDYDVLVPPMPEPENPRYTAWKGVLGEWLKTLEGDLILVGHSLGGSVLLKYISEERVPSSIVGVFLVATPFWGVEDWEIEEFILLRGLVSVVPPTSNIFLYHSRNDQWVPVEHVWLYAELLPTAEVCVVEGTEHEFYDGLPELIADIKKISV
jgi:uncharacterized protein